MLNEYLSLLVPEELAGVLDDLLVVELGVRLLLAEGQHLPHRHPEGPHVAGRGELTLEEGKRSSTVYKHVLRLLS